jgi:hypothetical protein
MKALEDEEAKERMNFGRYSNGMMPSGYSLGSSEYGDKTFIPPSKRDEGWNDGRGV